MDEMMMEPKGFKIEIKTVERTGAKAMVSDVSINEFCEKVKDILRSYSTFDGNQHLAVTVHSCNTVYEVDDSVINLVPDQNGRRSSTDYEELLDWRITIKLSQIIFFAVRTLHNDVAICQVLPHLLVG